MRSTCLDGMRKKTYHLNRNRWEGIDIQDWHKKKAPCDFKPRPVFHIAILGCIMIYLCISPIYYVYISIYCSECSVVSPRWIPSYSPVIPCQARLHGCRPTTWHLDASHRAPKSHGFQHGWFSSILIEMMCWITVRTGWELWLFP